MKPADKLLERLDEIDKRMRIILSLLECLNERLSDVGDDDCEDCLIRKDYYNLPD